MLAGFDWDRYNTYSYYDGFYPAPRRMAAAKEAPSENDITSSNTVKFSSKGAFAKKSAAETK
jgi:hypothetical protein